VYEQKKAPKGAADGLAVSFHELLAEVEAERETALASTSPRGGGSGGKDSGGGAAVGAYVMARQRLNRIEAEHHRAEAEGMERLQLARAEERHIDGDPLVVCLISSYSVMFSRSRAFARVVLVFAHSVMLPTAWCSE